MKIISSREFRTNMKAYLDAIDNNEEIVIQRGSQSSYKLIAIKEDDNTYSTGKLLEIYKEASTKSQICSSLIDELPNNLRFTNTINEVLGGIEQNEEICFSTDIKDKLTDIYKIWYNTITEIDCNIYGTFNDLTAEVFKNQKFTSESEKYHHLTMHYFSILVKDLINNARVTLNSIEQDESKLHKATISINDILLETQEEQIEALKDKSPLYSNIREIFDDYENNLEDKEPLLEYIIFKNELLSDSSITKLRLDYLRSKNSHTISYKSLCDNMTYTLELSEVEYRQYNSPLLSTRLPIIEQIEKGIAIDAYSFDISHTEERNRQLKEKLSKVTDNLEGCYFSEYLEELSLDMLGKKIKDTF